MKINHLVITSIQGGMSETWQQECLSLFPVDITIQNSTITVKNNPVSQ
jgi:hypothetical protein